MPDAKQAIPQERLSKFFGLFAPVYVLGTTYTISLAFFESVVFPCIKDRSRLKRCVLFCDRMGFQRAISEATALRGASRDYMVVTAPTSGTFHPKLWMLIGESQLALLVGSGNLTQSGFMDNIELFEVLELEASGTGREVVESALRFIRGLAAFWKDSPVHSLLAIDTLIEIEHKLVAFGKKVVPGDANEPRLLTSFDGSFIDHFSSLATDGELLVAAPYFGGSATGLKRLHAALKPRRTRVFPATHAEDEIDLPFNEVNAIPGVSLHSLALTSKREDFAHLKMYGFRSRNDDCWLFTGSVNCTEAALVGANIEAGLLRRVPPSTLELYFAQDKKSAVPENLRKEEHDKDSGWITSYATDLGDVIELVAAPGQDSRFPLKDVELSLRYGGVRLLCHRPFLFDHGTSTRLPWAWFDQGRLSSQAARVLEVHAKDSFGKPAYGAALVDDVAALSAEPTHRGAWRAALALLSAEEMPEYGDIAALFQLVDDVVDVEDNQDEAEVPTGGGARSPEGSTEVIEKDKAPVWPPQPIQADPALLSTASGRRGDLYWFNRILAALVHVPKQTSDDAAQQRPEHDEDDESDTKETPPAIISACQRMMTQAQSSLERLKRWLHRLEITPEKSRKLWGPATFVFLGNLGIKKSADRITAGEVHTPLVTSLISAYLSMMLADRDQGDDYSPPASSVYENAVFPPVAADLSQRFTVYPHFEICAILLVAFAHLQATSQGTFALSKWLLFRETARDNLALASEDKEHLEHIWRRYFGDDTGHVTWSSVAQAINSLHTIGWHDHPGFQDLLRLRGIHSESPNVNLADLHDNLRGLELCRKRGWPKGRVDRFTEACVNPHCPKQGRIDPRFRMLQNLQPVVCTACGYLHIPSELVDAFEKEQHG